MSKSVIKVDTEVVRQYAKMFVSAKEGMEKSNGNIDGKLSGINIIENHIKKNISKDCKKIISETGISAAILASIAVKTEDFEKNVEAYMNKYNLPYDKAAAKYNQDILNYEAAMTGSGAGSGALGGYSVEDALAGYYGMSRGEVIFNSIKDTTKSYVVKGFLSVPFGVIHTGAVGLEALLNVNAPDEANKFHFSDKAYFNKILKDDIINRKDEFGLNIEDVNPYFHSSSLIGDAIGGVGFGFYMGPVFSAASKALGASNSAGSEAAEAGSKVFGKVKNVAYDTFVKPFSKKKVTETAVDVTADIGDNVSSDGVAVGVSESILGVFNPLSKTESRYVSDKLTDQITKNETLSFGERQGLRVLRETTTASASVGDNVMGDLENNMVSGFTGENPEEIDIGQKFEDKAITSPVKGSERMIKDTQK